MLFARWITKNTDTHNIYYLLFFMATTVIFPALMLRYTYIASLVILLIFRYQNSLQI